MGVENPFWIFNKLGKFNKSSKMNSKIKSKQETLCVVTIAMICSTLASLWKSQYFRRPIYNSVEHLWWSFSWENSKSLSIFTKSFIIDASLGSKYAFAFWSLFKRFITLSILHYSIRLMKSVISLKYFTSLIHQTCY